MERSLLTQAVEIAESIPALCIAVINSATGHSSSRTPSDHLAPSRTIVFSAVETYATFLDKQVRRCRSQDFVLFHNQEMLDDDGFTKRVLQIAWQMVSLIGDSRRPCIDKLCSELMQLNLIHSSSDNQDAAFRLIFSLIGWMTMCYTPIVPGQTSKLQIQQEGVASFKRFESSISLVKRPLTEMLHTFGLRLPVEQRKSAVGTNCTSIDEALDVTLLNANILHRFTDIKIQWTTSLTTHLEFDESERRLSLFGLPSFCLLYEGEDISLLNK